MRKLATICKIDDIRPIDNADAIECAIVGGWTVVVKKGEYNIGDIVVYCEIDSWIPTGLAPFLSKSKEPREYNGIQGERLRTIKLRGQISQGLVLSRYIVLDKIGEIYTGMDVSELLGITKYLAPIPAALAGEVKGMFPSFIPKTDQERIQNLSVEFAQWKAEGLTWTITEKCEGSSFTAFFNNGEFNVCSRNLMLKENTDNTLWATANKYDLKNKMTELGRNIAIQAELLGPGVQGNIYKLSKHMLAVFDIFDIDTQQYMSPADCKDMIEQLGLTSVPVLTSTAELGDKNKTIDQLLKMADGASVMGLVGCKREGLVWKCNERRESFKTISNSYLLSNH